MMPSASSLFKKWINMFEHDLRYELRDDRDLLVAVVEKDYASGGYNYMVWEKDFKVYASGNKDTSEAARFIASLMYAHYIKGLKCQK